MKAVKVDQTFTMKLELEEEEARRLVMEMQLGVHHWRECLRGEKGDTRRPEALLGLISVLEESMPVAWAPCGEAIIIKEKDKSE